ncbi:unnamed protein product [Bodo saltans]|uniref:protein-tyrosine-phosphatase n=1 Tax=Bodo saltans TaxID=75058 RepID=A0A0S4IYN9_BODSA|nr:unnamed protein product [Bodo saltans]|eukprot:CUF99777.1 unnamed protein product [Bodo saltans]
MRHDTDDDQPALCKPSATSPIPAAPFFARGAGGDTNVIKEILARQQATRHSDLSLFPEADDEGDTRNNVGGVRKSPALARRSPGLRSAAAAAGRNRGSESSATRVLDFLFLGSVQDAKNVEFLRRNNITLIINVSQEEYYSPDPDRVTVRWFYAEDTSNFDIQKYFSITENILQGVRRKYFKSEDPARRESVLVHCQKGRSRSATIVMAHLIQSNGWSVAEALKWVGSLRETVEPNLGFIEALLAYQEALTADQRTAQRRRRCLTIRNKFEHTPLESSKDALRSFFATTVGMVSDIQVMQMTKEEDDEEDDDDVVYEHGGPSDQGATLKRSDTTLPEGVSPSNSRSVSPIVQTSSSEGQPTPHALTSSNSNENGSNDASSRGLQRVNSQVPLSSGGRSVVLVEFACWENVNAAGKLKTTNVSTFLPLCADPTTLVFQKPRTKAVGRKKKSTA